MSVFRARVGQEVDPPLYTTDQRKRRDASAWTLVQGILAPIQFLICLASLALIIRFMTTGLGYEIATLSVIVKTLALYLIMITGAIWEREVFGQFLFAKAFFWEDVFSMLVLALHALYVIVLLTGALDPSGQMLIALAAYLAYFINAAQFVLKLRKARLQNRAQSLGASGDNAPDSISLSSHVTLEPVK